MTEWRFVKYHLVDKDSAPAILAMLFRVNQSLRSPGGVARFATDILRPGERQRLYR